MQEIKLPQLGQSVEEATIVTWLKQEGDAVKTGDPLFTVQTDKAEIECESSGTGVLRKVLVEPDIEVAVMTVVALVGDADEPLPDLDQYKVDSAPAPAPTAAAEPAPAPAQPAAPAPVAAPAPPVAPPVAQGPASAISPRARRRAAELGVDPAQATGTGAGGRVMEADVEALAKHYAPGRITPAAKRVAEQRGIDIAQIAGTGINGKITKQDVLAAKPVRTPRPGPQVPPPASGEVRSVPLTPMRRIIAERMGESKYSAPHYYVTVEVDMSEAVAYRKSLRPLRISFNDLVMFATAQAIREYPMVNARWTGDAIEELGDVNLGFAVALPDGLIVPVVRQVQNLDLEGLNNATKALAEKARTGKLTPDDYSGSTFTISNLGAFGVDQFTAIINQPDSAILAVGRIKDRPVVVDGGIHVRPIMNLTLSSDHRVIDGAVAAQFMGALREILEEADF
ncbi:MAG: 2-oxo acid dehydrogenase subunit E2 [bacterium]|nr:2-oxo acid dehydrogenase subunit E2 [bacterium]